MTLGQHQRDHGAEQPTDQGRNRDSDDRAVLVDPVHAFRVEAPEERRVIAA